MTTRREALALLSGLTMASAFPSVGKAQSRKTVTLMTPFGYQADFIEMINATAGGHCEANGLDATLLGGNGTAQAMQQLIAGQVTLIRAAAIDLMRAVAATQAPLIATGTLHQASTFNVVSLASKPINTAEDMKGKTIGVVSVGGTTETFLDLMLRKVGLSKNDVKRETTGNSPGALQFLQQGRVDGFICAVNVLTSLEKMNAPIVSWSTDKYAPMPSQCYITTRDAIEKQPETVTAIMKALRGSVLEIIKGPIKPIYERAGKRYDIAGMREIDLLVATTEKSSTTLWVSEGRENLLRNVPRLWSEGASAMRDSGIADIKNIESIYTNQFADAAAKG